MSSVAASERDRAQTDVHVKAQAVVHAGSWGLRPVPGAPAGVNKVAASRIGWKAEP